MLDRVQPSRGRDRPTRGRGITAAKPLYVFFDEAGDLTFAPSGTRHYLCGVTLTHDPWAFEHGFTALRAELF